MVGLVALMGHAAQGAVVYSEDFSDVGEWVVIYDHTGSGASITTDGEWGSLHVDGANNFVAFGPLPALQAPTPYLLSPNYRYQLRYRVTGLTGSTSYSIEVDQFDESLQYISTVFGLAAQGTYVGESVVGLSGFPFDPTARYILPKITVYTGLGNQSVQFDQLDIELEVLPEPSSLIFVMLGAAVVGAWRKAARPTAKHGARKVNKQ